MKEYLIRHKFNIIFLFIIVVLSFILIPNEKKHYLTENVTNFKEKYYWSIMKMVSLFIILFVIIYKRIYNNKLKEIAIDFFKLTIICLVFSFLLQNVLLSVLLYINRLKTSENISKEYIVIDKINPEHFIAKEVKTEKTITERDYLKLNKNDKIDTIQINDTLKVSTKKGIFGIEFF